MPGLAFTDLPPGSPFMFDNEQPVDIEPRSMATPMARVARIARGELSAAEHERLVDEATRLDPHWCRGVGCHCRAVDAPRHCHPSASCRGGRQAVQQEQAVRTVQSGDYPTGYYLP